MKAPWTEADKARLCAQYPAHPNLPELAEEMGRTLSALHRKASDLGLTRVKSGDPLYPIPADELPLVIAFNNWAPAFAAPGRLVGRV